MDKQYNHLTAEPAIQQTWEVGGTYLHENNPGQPYRIDTPPPTVSGSLHIGHMFSYTQADIIARYQRMNGRSVFYPIGFDDNGLATERFVEKKQGITAHSMPRSEFITRCLEETHNTEKQFETLWRRMGLSFDWRATYSTISETTRRISQESFIHLYNQGHIYRKKEPALYCTTCRTSVAQAELDSQELPSHFCDLVFKTTENQDLIIGTTRPELLPSCVALLYHPDDTRYAHLVTKQAVVPLFNFTVPILTDPAVDPEKGTGLVMCCTFGDKTDVAWFKAFKFPFKQSIGINGKMTELAGEFAGLSVPVARTKIIERAHELGILKNKKPITHAVQTHERCKKEIEYQLLEQWFINILDHKKTFIDLADQIEWYPAFMKTRYQHWVEHLSWDWCISRQRFFGIPFPAWHCSSCGHIILATPDQLPLDPQETPYRGSCPQCKHDTIVPDTDVMDTWNTSSITPYLCKNLFDAHASPFEKKTDFIPMDMRPQAHDIIRTWAFYTIVKTWMHHGTIPWKKIVISGHVLSDAHEKLSKSKENSPLSPEGLLSRYPADALRYWTASARLGTDVSFSESQIKIGGRLVTKLWNAFRFLHEHAKHEQPPTPLGTVNEWILHHASATYDRYEQHLNTHEFALALDEVEKFFWHKFCDNYLELIKDQFFNEAAYSPDQVKATRWTLYHVGIRILQLYAPYLPHITEHLYKLLYEPHEKIASLHQTKFRDYQVAHTFDRSEETMNVVLTAINVIRRLKTEQQLSLKTELASLTISSINASKLALVKDQEQLVRGMSKAHTITYLNKTDDRSSAEQRDGAWHAHITIDTHDTHQTDTTDR